MATRTDKAVVVVIGCRYAGIGTGTRVIASRTCGFRR